MTRLADGHLSVDGIETGAPLIPSARKRHAESIRLLLVDEEIAPGGVERMWLALAPELAQRCDSLVWMMPAHRLGQTQSVLPGSAIHFEPSHWPAWGIEKVGAAVGRRLARITGRGSDALQQRMEARLGSMRIQALVRAHHITHLLYPALFTQTFPRTDLPVFATIMDVNYHPSRRKQCLASLRDWAARATGLIAISEFTRHEVERVCPQARGKVTAIPCATEKVPVRSSSHRLEVRPADAASYVPCLYYPATFNPHKGHALLLKAVQMLQTQGTPVHLKLSGALVEQLRSSNALADPELEEARLLFASSAEPFRNLIDVLGFIEPEEVEACYADADLVVLPSFYEGYGLPLVEAVVRGKRVLCSDIPAFRQQVRQYGLDEAVKFVDESSAEAWAAALQAALSFCADSPYSSDELDAIFARWTWADVAGAYLGAMAGHEQAVGSGGADAT